MPYITKADLAQPIRSANALTATLEGIRTRKAGRLVLGRKEGESIYIGEDILITVASLQGRSVKLAIQAPLQVNIVRSELLQEPVNGENTALSSPLTCLFNRQAK